MDLKATLSLPALCAGASAAVPTAGLPPSPPSAGLGMGMGMGVGAGPGPSFCPMSVFQPFLSPPPPPPLPMFSSPSANLPFSLGVGLPPFPWPGMPGAQYALMSGLLRQSDFLQGRLKLHEEPKPNHSYIGLIAMAILSSKDKKMLLSEIYDWILKTFSYFRNKGPGWRNSIRHNLSLNDCFIKVGRAANGKGHYWAIHPANLEDFKRGDFRRRKAQRKVRRHMGLACAEDEDSSTPSPPHSPLTLSPPASATGPCPSARCRSPSCVNSYSALSPNDTGLGSSPERRLLDRDHHQHSHERDENVGRDEVGSVSGALKAERDSEMLEAENCEPGTKNNNWLPVPVAASWPSASSASSTSAPGLGAGGMSATSPHPWSTFPSQSHSHSYSARICSSNTSSTSPIANGQPHSSLRSQRSFDVDSLLAPDQPSPTSPYQPPASAPTCTSSTLSLQAQVQLGFSTGFAPGTGLANPLGLGVGATNPAADAQQLQSPPVDPMAAAAYLHYFAQLNAICRTWQHQQHQQLAAAASDALTLALPAADL